MTIACGIDIGGTKLALGLVSPAGTLTGLRSISDHTGLNESDMLDLVARQVRTLCQDQGTSLGNLDGVAVGMAGHMRSRDGVVLTTSNLKGFKQYPLVAELSRRLDGTRVILENDANCQAWAEYRFGAGRGHDDMVFLTISTGIGAGLVLNGRLYRGLTGTAGEIGHAIVDAHSDALCTCGNKGCFMSLASTLNLDDVARKKSRRFTNTRIPTGSDRCRVNGHLVMELAGAGDPAAVEIVNDYADWLGILVYNVFQIFNPSAVVLGGGLMNWECGFFERIQGKFHELAGDMLHDPLLIAKAETGVGSGILGAGALLWGQ